MLNVKLTNTDVLPYAQRQNTKKSHLLSITIRKRKDRFNFAGVNFTHPEYSWVKSPMKNCVLRAKYPTQNTKF